MEEQINSSDLPIHRIGQDHGKLLLICNGPGLIVFAHGDASLLGMKLDGLRHKHFFSLGFSQYSLLKIQQLSEGGVLDPPKTRNSFSLELVKPYSQTPTSEQFYLELDAYLKPIEVHCSLIQVKFSQDPIQVRTSRVIKDSINTLRQGPQERLMTLIEITAPSRMFHFKTSYEDYVLTRRHLSTLQEPVKKQEQ